MTRALMAGTAAVMLTWILLSIYVVALHGSQERIVSVSHIILLLNFVFPCPRKKKNSSP